MAGARLELELSELATLSEVSERKIAVLQHEAGKAPSTMYFASTPRQGLHRVTCAVRIGDANDCVRLELVVQANLAVVLIHVSEELHDHLEMARVGGS